MEMMSLLGENLIFGLLLGFGLGFLFTLVSKTVKLFFIISILLLKLLEAQRIIIVDWYRLSMGLVGQKDLVIGNAIPIIDVIMEMGLFALAMVIGFFLAKRVF
jgi:uncharacterized membrane protein (Fun14 family)